MKILTLSFIVCSFALLQKPVHGKPGNRIESQALLRLLKSLAHRETVFAKEVKIASDFSLDVVNCDEITPDIESDLESYLEKSLTGKVTLSCSDSSTDYTAVAEALQAGIQSGGAFIRWGHDECPNTRSTTMLYTGRMAGRFFNQKGGGANFLCLPDTPKPNYDEIETTDKNSYSRIYGTEYEGPIKGVQDHGAPCALCYVSTRTSQIMIPATTTCPNGWTREYYGYIMSESNTSNRSPNEYVCVDKDQISLPGSAGNENGSLLYHVRATCTGINCPPYKSDKSLTCAVCTK